MHGFFKNLQGYPLAEDASSINRLLHQKFTKAVIYNDGSEPVDTAKIFDASAFEKQKSEFWRDKKLQKGLYADPGRIQYTPDTLYPQNILDDAKSCGIIMDRKTAHHIHKKMMWAAQVFSKVTTEYLQRDDFHMRMWPVWAPTGILGRTPYFHIDRTYLTGLWYAGRATAEIYTGDVPEKVWNALGPERNNEHQNNAVLRSFTNAAQPDHIHALPSNALIITKNSKDRNLENKKDRRGICIHRSGNVPALGQAGVIMVPKFEN